MVVSQSGDLTLEMQRVLSAPSPVVFVAFSDPDQMARWWEPEGFTVANLEFDPSVGAKLPHRDAAAGRRSLLPHRTEFREVDPPVRLAFTFVYEDPDPDDVDTLVELSFRDLGKSTELVLRQGPFKTAARRGLHRDGWTDSFEKLEQFISKRRPLCHTSAGPSPLTMRQAAVSGAGRRALEFA